jgi:hypothetical protein
MSINPITDLSKVYLEQVSESHVPGKPAERLGAVTAISKDERDAARERTLAKAKAMRKKKPERWWDDDGDGVGYEKGEVSGKFVRKEAKETPKRWWDDDGDGVGYEKGEVSGKFKKKKIKEGFSNWREDLSEVMVGEKERGSRVQEKKVRNKIKVFPTLGEAVENIGGTLLEMVEVDELLDEGDIEEALYRGLGVGRVERVSSGSYVPPTKKKPTEKPADPWAGSETTPPKPKAKKRRASNVKVPAPKASAPKRKRKSKLDNLLADIRKEEIQIDEKTLTATETIEKERLVKSMKDKEADFENRYPGRGKEVMYATATKMAKKIAEQQLDELAPLVAGGLALGGAALAGMAIKKAQDAAKSGVDAAKSGAKVKPGQTGIAGAAYNMQRRNQQLQQLMNQSYEPEGETIDELNRYEKEKGKDYKTGKPVTKGGTMGGDDTHSKVMRHMHKVMGAGRMGAGGAIQPRGKKKVPGKKPPKAGEYGSERRSPEQIVKGRRIEKQRAQELMHSRFD